MLTPGVSFNPVPFGACQLCTDRPRAVSLDMRLYLAGEPDEAEGDNLSRIEYRKGPKGKGKRVALSWAELCPGCSHDVVASKEAAQDAECDATIVAMCEREAQGDYRTPAILVIPLDWAALGAVVLGLRD